MRSKKVQMSQRGDAIEKKMQGKPASGNPELLNHEQERIRKWLKQVRFRKAFFGGVDEADVWKKIAELNSMYESGLSAERARYDALLKEHADTYKNKYAETSCSAQHGEERDESGS